MNFLLQHWLEKTADASSESEAVMGADLSFTYRELDTLSDRIANLLESNGFQRQDRAVILLRRDPRVLAAIFGVLKADGIYVPVDGRTPTGRLSVIVENCAPKVIFCDQYMLSGLMTLREQWKTEILFVVMDADDIQEPRSAIGCRAILRASGEKRRYRAIPNDPAYIIYTSGSTGTPKGVAVSHANVRNYIDWAVAQFDITADDRIMGTAPFGFDMSVFDLYCPIKAGATLCIATEKNCMFPGQLADFIAQSGVTLWKGVASLVGYLAWSGVIRPGIMPKLRTVLFGGEVLPIKHLATWMNACPEKRYINCYGPTESTGVSVFHEITKAPAPGENNIPIGRPIDNMECLILDEEGREAANADGELFLRGSSVGLGYWNDRALTEERFVSRPGPGGLPARYYRTGDRVSLDRQGNLRFLGRADTQVKYMGYRIDLLEIERALQSLDGVRDAAVTLKANPIAGKEELVALIEYTGGGQVTDLSSLLHHALPAYMIPRKILECETLPRNERGKLDSKAVAALLDLTGEALP